MKNLYPPIFDLCRCGCNEIVWNRKRYIHGHYTRINNPSKKGQIPWNKGLKINTKNKLPYPSIPDLCHCGCGQIVYGGRRFISGHNARNQIRSEETNRKISKSNIGHKVSNEVRKKISKSLKGKNTGDLNPAKRPEVKAKISQNRTGIGHTEESKKKISISKKGCYLGSNNPNWRGGLSFEPYCHKFNNPLKNEIRKRDDYICQHPNCLCTQLESITIYKESLVVHHIHYDKQNCYPDLITLCHKHNSGANYNRNYYEKLFMEILEKRNLLNWNPNNV